MDLNQYKLSSREDKVLSAIAHLILLGVCTYICWGIPAPYKGPSIALLWVVWKRDCK